MLTGENKITHLDLLPWETRLDLLAGLDLLGWETSPCAADLYLRANGHIAHKFKVCTVAKE